MSAVGRVHPVTTGCFQAAHLQGLVCGGEPGRASVTSRPTADFQIRLKLTLRCRKQTLNVRAEPPAEASADWPRTAPPTSLRILLRERKRNQLRARSVAASLLVVKSFACWTAVTLTLVTRKAES